MKLVIIKNEGLTYLRGLERGELKEDGIPRKVSKTHDQHTT